MPKWVRVITLIFLFVGPTTVVGQSISETISLGGHVVEVTAWDSSDGLPGSHISNFFQSSKGVLFLHFPKFGTFTFDGKETRLLPPPPGQAANLGGVGVSTYFAEDVNGNIWTITKRDGDSSIGNIVVSDGYGHRSESFTSYTGIPKDSIGIFQQSSGLFVLGDDIYFAAREGLELWKYDGELRLDVDLEPLGTSCQIYPTLAKDRYLLVNPVAKELSLIDGEGKVRGALDSAYRERIKWELNTLLSYKGDVFFNTRSSNIERLVLDGDELSLEGVPSSVSQVSVGNIPFMDTGKKAEGYQLLHQEQLKNQVYYDGEHITEDLDSLLKEKANLELRKIGIKADQNSFWITSNSHLVHLRFSKKPFKAIELPSPSTSVRSISPIGENQLLVSTYRGNYLLHTLDGIGEATTTLDNLPYIRSRVEINGAYWLGTEYERLSLMNGVTGQQLELTHIFPVNGVVSAIAPQKNGKLLLGTSVGLKEFDPDTGQESTVSLANQQVHTIYTSPDQTTWIGHQGGLLNYTTQETHLVGFQVRHIYDDAGVFWIATNQGLIRWEVGSSNHQLYVIEYGLANNTIHCVYPDKTDNLWMSTDYGLVKFSKAPPHAVQVFFEEDGLPGNEFNQFAHYRNEEGELYLGGMKGLIKFNPDSIHWEGASTHFPIALEEVLVYDNENQHCFEKQLADVSPLPPLQLPSNSHRVELKFISPYYGGAELVKEWRTNRLYPEWTRVNENKINFHFVNYGVDELEIRTHPLGNTSRIETFKIKLNKTIPFHKTTFFFCLLTGVLVIGTYFLAKERGRYERKKLKKLVQQKTLGIEQQRAAIEAQKGELEKVSSYREKFFKNITHDFKTPLSIILGSSEQISKQKKTPPAVLTQVERIRKNALQLNSLTEQIFELSKIDNKRLQLNESTVEWGSFCRNIFESLAPLAEEKSIDYRIEQLPGQLVYLRIDLQKMEQILRNLLGNAIKFTPASGRISFSTTIQEDSVVFQVEDSGPGIAANESEDIYKRYFQGVVTDGLHFTGLGIGLSLCKDYLELMNGTIKTVPSSSIGACFQVRFPKKISAVNLVEEISPLADYKAPIKQHESSIIFNHNKPVLLIVEDNPDLLNYLKESLAFNYSLLLAKNGKEALNLLAKSHLSVDLIISDVMMPKMNGYEFIDAIKKQQQYASIPFIFLTALSASVSRMNALRVGVDAYITKPFSIDELSVRIENLLRYKRLRTAGQQAKVIKGKKQALEINEDEIARLNPTTRKWLAQLEDALTKRIVSPDLRINEIASDLNISERTLRTKIKSITGLTPNEYIMKMRLATALTLLQNGRYKSVAEVCYQIGLKNTSYFAKMFKKEYGRSPSSSLKDNFMSN